MKYSGEAVGLRQHQSLWSASAASRCGIRSARISHSLFRKVRQTEHVRAGQLDYQAEDYARIHARNTLITSKDITKLDSEQIHVG